MTSLKYQSTFKIPDNWANAPEFVPRTTTTNTNEIQSTIAATAAESSPGPSPGALVITTPSSYASAAASSAALIGTTPPGVPAWNFSQQELCAFAMIGECRYGDACANIHGLPCEYCARLILHPYDPVQREKHTRDCVQEHERNMELSFAVARSKDMRCGICMDFIMEKTPPGEQRFGILPSCLHCYCLECIRRWRRSKQFEKNITRGCPECRKISDFVCPSRYWFDNKEDKDKLIDSYKVALGKKPCRYYKSGNGTCPFGNKCFYLHALPNGVVVDVGPPRPSNRRPRVRASNLEFQDLSIYDLLEEFEMEWMGIDDFLDMFDSDNQSEFSSDLDF